VAAGAPREGRSSRTLGAGNRLRRRAEFQQAFDLGRRVHGRYFTVIVRPNDLGRPRLGVVATRKLGGAVARNRAKRRVRELFRTLKPAAAIDLVVIVRRELLDTPFVNLEVDFRSVLRRACQ
jgi:ribonuclease P protein component